MPKAKIKSVNKSPAILVLFCVVLFSSCGKSLSDSNSISPEDNSYNELPVLKIETKNQENITSKDYYLESKISLLNIGDDFSFENIDAGISGRGNSSWDQPKKPYKIKFDKKRSILGSPYQAKKWTLIVNYSDKSLLRNYIAYEFGDKLDGISFSSQHTLVDLYLNDSYRGVYLLCDQIEVGEGRINIDNSISSDGNNGYLIERDQRIIDEGILGVDYFMFRNQSYAIKSPSTKNSSYLSNKETEIEYITSYMDNSFNTIKNGTWDEVKSFIDVDSFVDSYFVDELFANNDCGFASCYYFKDKNGKLTKGPLWDFDIGAGNVNYNYGSEKECLPDKGLFANAANIWYWELLKRKEFKNAVQKRISELSPIVDYIMNLLNPDEEESIYQKNKKSLERNFEKWEIMGKYVWPEPESVYVIDSLVGQIDYLRNWLNQRYQFLCRTYV